MKKYLVGVDLGGTKIYTALADLKGRILAESILPAEANKGKGKVISNIITSIYNVIEQKNAKAAEIKAIGIGSPGNVNFSEGIIYNPPNLPGWNKVPLKKILQNKLKTQVFVDNDANVAALAELKFGAGKGKKDFIYVTISTGIGGGIISDGKLLRGAEGAAGEVGHMTVSSKKVRCGCGQFGHLEALSSGTAIKNMTGMDAFEFEKKVRGGDKKAKQFFSEMVDSLGIGLANLINIFNPEMIIIGGGLSNMGSLLLAPVASLAKKYAMPFPAKKVKIVKAKLGRKTGVIGAIALCLD